MVANASQGKAHLRSALRGVSKKLKASLDASSDLGDSLTKGVVREEEVAAAFGPHLPERYQLVKGVVVNSQGEESDPQDLIILDTFAAPSFGGGSTTRVVPAEGVCGVVQIKSQATTVNARAAVKNLASAKALLPRDLRYGLPLAGNRGHMGSFQVTNATFFGGALFMALHGSAEGVGEAFTRECLAQPPHLRPDAMCVVDEFNVLWGNPSKPGLEFSFRAEDAEAPLMVAAGDDSLLFFYLSLLEHLRHWITPPMDLLSYVNNSGLEFQYSFWTDDEDEGGAT